MNATELLEATFEERRKLLGFRQVLVGFPEDQLKYGQLQLQLRSRETVVLQKDVAMPFAPLGLFLWGVTEETKVERITATNWIEGMAGWAPVPGKYFETGQSFEELGALAREGRLEAAVPLRQLLRMHEVLPGCSVKLELSGPFANACFWGVTYADSQSAVLRARVKERPHSGPTPPGVRPAEVWEGVLEELRLTADIVVGVVEAPSEESAVALLQVLRRR